MSGSGSHSALGATKTLHRLHSSSPQPDDTVSVSERRNTSSQPTAKAGLRTTDSTRTVQRPPSASGHRPPTAPGRSRRAVRHSVSNSYVDESLFGPVTDDISAMSRQSKQRPVKPFIFDCTDYKAKASKASSSVDEPSSRPSSQMSARSRPRSARLNMQPSFVDESLFGDQLELSTWRAPWEKKDRRPKPFIFDATNYRQKQQQTSDSESRLQHASSANRGTTRQLPPWR